jgi:HEPN domain-containing protein
MNEATRNLTLSWLGKASRDLAAARQLGAGEPALPDVAVYHCQQAAEKALKGYLIAHEIRPEKTHDVGKLIRKVSLIEANFAAFEDAGERLTPFATDFRYPGIEIQPSVEVFEMAVQDAEQIFRAVVESLRSAFQLAFD